MLKGLVTTVGKWSEGEWITYSFMAFALAAVVFNYWPKSWPVDRTEFCKGYVIGWSEACHNADLCKPDYRPACPDHPTSSSENSFALGVRIGVRDGEYDSDPLE